MTLEQAVQFSQISIPFVLGVLGYFFSKSLNKEQRTSQREYLLRQNAANVFYEKTLVHLDCISNFTTLVQTQGFNPIDQKVYAEKVSESIMNLMSSARDVEIYKGVSENTREVVKAVELSEKHWRDFFETLKGESGEQDFSSLFESQKTIVVELVKFQNTEILGQLP